MKISDALRRLVSQRAPFSGRIESVVAEEEGVTVRCDVTTAETVGCSLAQLDVVEERQRVLNPDDLCRWAEWICGKVTYLTEPLGLVEIDRQSGLAVVRSKPPLRRGERIAYYEMLADRHHHASLRRYQYDVRSKRRGAVSFPLTHEQLEFLVDDLAESGRAMEE